MRAVGYAWSVKVRRGKIGPNKFNYVSGTKYNYGIGKPKYPVPALYDPFNKWHFYWSMPSFPTLALNVGWHLWNDTLPPATVLKPQLWWEYL